MGRGVLVTVDTDEMTTEVMLATKGATTRAVWADMGLEPVWIVGGHVCL